MNKRLRNRMGLNVGVVNRVSQKEAEAAIVKQFMGLLLFIMRPVQYSIPKDNHGYLMRPKTRFVKFLAPKKVTSR